MAEILRDALRGGEVRIPASEIAPVAIRAAAIEAHVLVARAQPQLRVLRERRIGKCARRPRRRVAVQVLRVVHERRAALDAEAQRIAHTAPRAGEELLLAAIQKIEFGRECVVVEVVVADDEIPVRVADEGGHARGILEPRETLHVAQRRLVNRVLRDRDPVVDVQPQMLAHENVEAQMRAGIEQQRLRVEAGIVEIFRVAQAEAEADRVQPGHLPFAVQVHARAENQVALPVEFREADVVIHLQIHLHGGVHLHRAELHESPAQLRRLLLPRIRRERTHARGTDGLLRVRIRACETGERKRTERLRKTEAMRHTETGHGQAGESSRDYCPTTPLLTKHFLGRLNAQFFWLLLCR